MTINATEALYGFWDWVCQNAQKEYIGGGFHGGNLRGQLAKFCEENDLPMLEDGWLGKVKYPQKATWKKAAKGMRHEKKKDVVHEKEPTVSNRRKETFSGYITEGWQIETHTHKHLAGFHECIDISHNICTEQGLENAGKGRRKVEVTVEEI